MLCLLTNASEKCSVRNIYRNQKMSFEFERGVRRQRRNPGLLNEQIENFVSMLLPTLNFNAIQLQNFGLAITDQDPTFSGST
jgi:hypothetical protein